MSKTGIIILCHGSRGERALEELPAKMERVVAASAALVPGNITVAWAALQFNVPTLEETAASLIERGATSIIIMPYFIFSGRHIKEDIPEVLEKLKADYPDISFTMTRSLGEGEFFIPQVADRIRETVPRLWLEASGISNPAGSIEPLSMEIIDKLLPDTTTLTPGEVAVLKRVIHAGGDPQLAGLVRFGPGAAAAGIAALRQGCPVFTDVRMVAAGISAEMANTLDCTAMCALDETVNSNGQPGQQTRAAKAIRHLGTRLNGAVVAIGNAPTALLALLDLIESQGIKPALVVGMPVGFVQAAESKEALMQRASNYITISGTRGGSPLAAATINALMKSALQPDTAPSGTG